MRKTILKITLGGALAITAAMGVQMASSNKTMSNLIMQNVEALASGEEGSGNCPMYELSRTEDIIVYANAKKIILSKKCKQACNYTCTIEI